MADTCQNQVDEIFKGISRHINCFSEENRNTRKRAIENIKKDILGRNPELDSQILQSLLSQILKPILKLLSDPVEKCRENSIDFLSRCVQKIPEPVDFLPYLIPVLVQRLGQQEITEPSEELRLQLCQLLHYLIVSTGKQMPPYLGDIVQVLQRTIVDAYPEVRKQSCNCASQLAKTIPQYFHAQSETLIPSLIVAISHQHAKVRVEVVNAIGDVIQYGNNKSVSDVVSHLAQRLFDRSPLVRAAVIQVVGNWLLDLLDRYSFFPKLIPLLLTGITDDVPDIQAQADALWHDVGLKYERENEADFKDKQNFVKAEIEHYPQGIERPNLGCRMLMYYNFSKILPGLVHDITDWVVDTRIKSAHLLYSMLLNEEDNVTQHLEKLLNGLYKAAGDEEKEVVTYVKKSAELVGYFVSPEVWCKMVLKHVQLSQSAGSLMVLSCILAGSQRSKVMTYLPDICATLTDPLIYRVADGAVQNEVLACVRSMLAVSQADCATVSLSLFDILVSVMALHRSDTILTECERLLQCQAMALGRDSVQVLYEDHTRQLISSLQEDYSRWTQHSVERQVFDTLLMSCGPVVGDILDDVIPMLVANLNPDKDAEVRLKFFSLLSRLMLNASHTLDSQHRFGDFAVTVVQDMVIPNCVWRAGRVATAIRTTAVSCLWALLQSGVLTKDKLLVMMEDLVTHLRGTLEDDNSSTRLVSCRILTRIFSITGQSLEQNRLHNMYPDLLKRLDDSSNDIRVAMCQTLQAYFGCFMDGYEVGLYRAHLEALYKGLLVHMDDPDTPIQEAVLEVMKTAASIAPDMLLKEIDLIQHKHRSTKYCSQLVQHVHNLPKPS